MPAPSGNPASLTFDDTSLTNFTPFVEQNYDVDSLHFFSNNSYSFDGASGTTITLETKLESDAPGNVTFSSNIGFSLPSSQQWDIYGDTIQISGVISGPGTAALTLNSDNTGTGFLRLDSTNTYTGGTTLQGGLTVFLNADEALGTGPLTIDSSTLSALSAVTLDNAVTITNSFSVNNSAPLTLSGPVLLDTSPDISVSGDGNSPLIIAGDINESGSQSLTVNGGGYVQLSGNNVYSGGTTILNATVIASGTSGSPLGSGPVTLGNSDQPGTLAVDTGTTLTNVLMLTKGTLAGTGTFAPDSTPVIGSNLTVAPGFTKVLVINDTPVTFGTIGTLTFSTGLELAGGGTVSLKFKDPNGTAGSGWDLVSISGGTLNLTATSGNPITLTLSSYDSETGAAGLLGGFNPSSSYSWQIVSASNATGFDSTAFNIDASAFHDGSLDPSQFSVSLSGNSLFLNFTPVPEPSTLALLSLGAAAIVGAGLRRRKARGCSKT
ncbi:MAG TPA: PEP-CTERM sorting domain-containing protein [Opitutaceae bacterium]|nr:PEP-CTERM sorting domain-containing protein [Opitutaceae bacterium]